jgi:hypothetical protein
MASEDEVVYELRTYHAYPEKFDELLARFRDYTLRIFEKHGIKSIAYFTASDEPLQSKTLIYIVEHRSREAAKASWKNMGADPEWQAIKAKTEANGKLFEKIDSTFMKKTDFSPPLS